MLKFNTFYSLRYRKWKRTPVEILKLICFIRLFSNISKYKSANIKWRLVTEDLYFLMGMPLPNCQFKKCQISPQNLLWLTVFSLGKPVFLCHFCVKMKRKKNSVKRIYNGYQSFNSWVLIKVDTLCLQVLDKRVSRNHATIEINKDGKLVLLPVRTYSLIHFPFMTYL